MVYLPEFAIHVGKYTIHGSYWIYNHIPGKPDEKTIFCTIFVNSGWDLGVPFKLMGLKEGHGKRGFPNPICHCLSG